MLKLTADLSALVEINLKVRYRQTFIGFLWVIANPVLLYSVQALVFGHLLHELGPGYYFYLFSGLIPWFYLSQTAEMSCNAINSNSRLLRNLKIHPFKLIAGLALENYINFLCASLLIFGFLFFQQNAGVLDLFRYVLTSFWLVLLVINIGFISSLINVLYKDTRFILHFLFTVLYFMTPSFYYEKSLPEAAQTLIQLNPFYWIIGLFRPKECTTELLTVNLVIMILLSGLSTLLWKKLKYRVYLKL